MSPKWDIPVLPKAMSFQKSFWGEKFLPACIFPILKAFPLSIELPGMLVRGNPWEVQLGLDAEGTHPRVLVLPWALGCLLGLNIHWLWNLWEQADFCSPECDRMAGIWELSALLVQFNPGWLKGAIGNLWEQFPAVSSNLPGQPLMMPGWAATKGKFEFLGSPHGKMLGETPRAPAEKNSVAPGRMGKSRTGSERVFLGIGARGSMSSLKKEC